MRLCYSQESLIWQAPDRRRATGVLSSHWRQDWFFNLCLAAILTALIFLMLLSIYLVFTKPAPTAVPRYHRTGATTGGSGFAVYSNGTGDVTAAPPKMCGWL